MCSDGRGYHGNGVVLWPWMYHTNTRTHTHIHSSSLPRSLSISSCIHIRSYRCPQKYHPSWFWLTHSRGGGSQLVMVLISHNALQPLGTHCARSKLINIHEPSDEYANGKKRRWPGEQPQLTNQKPPYALDIQEWETWQEMASQGIKGNSSWVWF